MGERISGFKGKVEKVNHSDKENIKSKKNVQAKKKKNPGRQSAKTKAESDRFRGRKRYPGQRHI